MSIHGKYMKEFQEKIMPAVPSFKKSGWITLTWPEKELLENAYKEIGGEPIDKTCNSCITETMQRLISYINKHKNS